MLTATRKTVHIGRGDAAEDRISERKPTVKSSDGACKATAVEEPVIHEEYLFGKLPSMSTEDLEIVLSRRELRTMINVAVSNVMMLIDDLNIRTVQTCTAEG